jgi:hypothetical protein
MKGEYKTFDKKLFQQNDPKSRDVVKTFLNKKGIEVKDNSNQYGIDLISINGNIKFEVERRLVWNRYEFPFNEVNLLERKTKFFTESNTYYIIVSKDYTRIGIINNSDIKKYMTETNLKESKNKFVSHGEMFYKLPKEKFKWIDVDTSS